MNSEFKIAKNLTAVYIHTDSLENKKIEKR